MVNVFRIEFLYLTDEPILSKKLIHQFRKKCWQKWLWIATNIHKHTWTSFHKSLYRFWTGSTHRLYNIQHMWRKTYCVGNPIFHSHKHCAITIIHCVKPVNSQSNSAPNELYLEHIWSYSQSCLRLRKAPKSKFIRKSLDSIQSCQHIITTSSSVIQSVTHTLHSKGFLTLCTVKVIGITFLIQLGHIHACIASLCVGCM